MNRDVILKNRSNRRPKAHQGKPISSPIRTFTIESMTHEGHGVVRDQGKVTFVEGAMTGEQVEARLTKEGRQFNQATTLKRIHTSPSRRTPSCKHFEQCGGCQLQHMDVDAQRDLKTEWLRNQFRKLELPEQITRLQGEEFGYRRRARLSVFAKNQQVSMGFRAKASNAIVDIEQCQVLVPALQKAYADLRSYILQGSLVAKLGHVELLLDNSGAACVLRQTRDVPEADKAQLVEWANSNGIEVYWQLPDQSKVQVDAPRHYLVDGLKVNFHPQDFIQVNAQINDAMVEQAMAWLNVTQDDVVLDLFCGAGNFSLPLGKRAGQVLAVEAIESMVEMGQANAAAAGLDNTSFLAADLTLPPPNHLKKAKITKALLDPPRAGALEFLPTLVRLKPKQILYVSCNASTLARDAQYLVENGYRVMNVCMMDMFPQTSHVEAMMLLQK